MVETQRRVDEPSGGNERRQTATGRYVVTSSKFDFDHFRERRRLDLGPGHALDALAECLDAAIRQPGEEPATTLDRLASRLVGTAEHWALARALLRDLGTDDLIYAGGDDIGLTVAMAAAVRRRKLKIGIFYTAPARFRARTLSKLVAKLGVDLLPVAGADDKVQFLDTLGLGRRAILASEQTDTGFFHPATADPSEKSTALVTSCGLEQRDYATLTNAIDGLDVEVKICAVSPNFTSATVVAMPETLPEQVEMRRFEFAELRELYQRAAVTVVPLLANHYSAGMTTMMEAIACGSPVIITTNPGLAADFADQDLVIGVEPGDIEGLHRAIQAVLDDPDTAARRAERARAYVLANHSSVGYVERLCASLLSFHRS